VSRRYELRGLKNAKDIKSFSKKRKERERVRREAYKKIPRRNFFIWGRLRGKKAWKVKEVETLKRKKVSSSKPWKDFLSRKKVTGRRLHKARGELSCLGTTGKGIWEFCI